MTGPLHGTLGASPAAAAVASGVLASLAVLVWRRGRPRGRLAAALRTASPASPAAPTGGRSGARAAAVPSPVVLPSRVLPGPVAVAALSEQLAGLVRAGLPPARIWRAMAERSADPGVRALASAVLAGQYRGRPAAATLRSLLAGHTGPGGGALRQLVVALDVSERTGAPLAQALVRLAAALREEETVAQERAGALAGPRASALLLSLLPLAGLGLGGLLGGDPVHVLLRTSPGRACLLAGGLLWTLGRLWTVLLVRRAAAA